MSIEKRGNAYRVTQMVNGIRYRATFDHKPNQLEINRAMAEAAGKRHRIKTDQTFREACEEYLLAKSNVLSPSTVRSYRSIMRNLPANFMDKKVGTVTDLQLQKLVNDYTVGRSPKTVSSMAHFVVSVLKSADVAMDMPKLPQKKKSTPYIPTEDEVKLLFEYFKGSEYEVPISLATLGLRRSEICALSVNDLKENTLTIDKALVEGEDGKFVMKQTKTTESTRTIVIPEELAERIRQQGYVFNGFPGTILTAMNRAQDKLGIHRFKLHALRHFFASYMHQLGYTDKQIQAMGGWKTDNVLKTVYQHAMEMEEAKENMAKDIGRLFT